MKTNSTDNASPRALHAGQSLGRAVRLARVARGMPQADLADRARVSRSTLQRIERGEVGVALAAWLNVMEALGLLSWIKDLRAAAEQSALIDAPRKRAASRRTPPDLDF